MSTKQLTLTIDGILKTVALIYETELIYLVKTVENQFYIVNKEKFPDLQVC